MKNLLGLSSLLFVNGEFPQLVFLIVNRFFEGFLFYSNTLLFEMNFLVAVHGTCPGLFFLTTTSRVAMG
jgi:hypothetical protein